ncbi:uncharacterized protein H6S33_012283 [Morchella sextelata]|uniref:uncharacterized protein n=1 Tax=Morchella sextelata TaxID=1174677 RepID=UPI001D05484E|nr:uncharacterized protein H6S33_012283 [Morchella sextelata]KAH0609737.1 hypothetical protein H6S33_012283 [Morchella sextelata]
MSLLLPRTLRHTLRHTRPLRLRPLQASPYSTTPPPPPRRSKNLALAAAAATLTTLAAGTYTYTTTRTPTSTLNPHTFTPYTLTTKTPISAGPTPTSIFTLTPTSPSPPLPFTTGILSLQIKQPQLQIARPYTPLPPPPEKDDGTIRLLIKREPGGEMSRYLYSLPEGAAVELRGPQVDYVYTPSDLSGERKIVFFAGGTGIAPALQVASSLLGGEGGKGKGRAEILWAVRRREETGGAMADEVARLAGRVDPEGVGRLVVRVFVDGEGGIGVRDVEAAVGGGARVFVSGPEGFIGWIAGPKGFRDGREEQGPVGGMVGSVLRRKGGNVEVFKL